MACSRHVADVEGCYVNVRCGCDVGSADRSRVRLLVTGGGTDGQTYPALAAVRTVEGRAWVRRTQQKLGQAQLGLDAIREDAKRLHARHLELAGYRWG